MGKVFRPSTREASILRKIESSKEYARRKAIHAIRDCLEPLSNQIAMKLVEEQLVETNSKNKLEEHVAQCLEELGRADDFDVDYACAPFRKLITNPHVVSLYLTAFVIETLINQKFIIDIFGSDEEIYNCIHQQVIQHLPH